MKKNLKKFCLIFALSFMTSSFASSLQSLQAAPKQPPPEELPQRREVRHEVRRPSLPAGQHRVAGRPNHQPSQRREHRPEHRPDVRPPRPSRPSEAAPRPQYIPPPPKHEIRPNAPLPKPAKPTEIIRPERPKPEHQPPKHEPRPDVRPPRPDHMPPPPPKDEPRPNVRPPRPGEVPPRHEQRPHVRPPRYPRRHSRDSIYFVPFLGPDYFDHRDSYFGGGNDYGVESREPVAPEISPVEQKNFAREVLRLCNLERAKTGASPLKTNGLFNRAAKIRARELIQNFSHTRPDGSQYSTVFKQFYFGQSGTSAENINANSPTPEAVVKHWMNSEYHRENILNPKFQYLGVGYVKGNAPHEHYWVQLFYTP